MSRKTAIIVGAGPFISRSLGLYLAQQGYSIGLVSRTQRTLNKLASEIQSAGQNTQIAVCSADAGDQSSLTSALDTLKAQLGGRVEVLVYNAARVGPNPLLDLDPAIMEQDFKTAAIGTLVAGQWFSKNADQQRHPLFLITGGTLDRQPNAEYASLSAVKSASQCIAVMFSQVLPKEHGILVGTPLIVEPIIPTPLDGGYATRSDPDVIVDKIYRPYFEQRENGRDDWVVERIW